MQAIDGHSFYRSSVEGHIHMTRYKKLRLKNENTESFRVYSESWITNFQNNVAPAKAMPLTYVKLAEVLRRSYYIGHDPAMLSRAHNFVKLALIEGEKLC